MELLEIRRELDQQWKVKRVAIDWIGLEDILVAIFNAEATNEWKVDLAKEAIDAYTKRGHFKKI